MPNGTYEISVLDFMDNAGNWGTINIENSELYYGNANQEYGFKILKVDYNEATKKYEGILVIDKSMEQH